MDLKEELDAVQMLPEDTLSMLPGGLDTDVGDRDHAMVRKPRGFRRVRTGLSISMESQALFNSFKKPWMSTRNTIQYHEFHFVAIRVLEIPSVEQSPPL